MAPKKEETSDFRLYLDERFNSLHQRLNSIEKNQEDTDLSVKEIAHIVDTMRTQENDKCIQCLNTKEVKDIRAELGVVKTGLGEVLFIKKYYRQFAMAGMFSVLIFLFGSTAIIIEIKKWITSDTQQEVKTEVNSQRIEGLTKKVNVNTGVINNNAEVQKEQIKREKENK